MNLEEALKIKNSGKQNSTNLSIKIPQICLSEPLNMRNQLQTFLGVKILPYLSNPTLIFPKASTPNADVYSLAISHTSWIKIYPILNSQPSIGPKLLILAKFYPILPNSAIPLPKSDSNQFLPI